MSQARKRFYEFGPFRLDLEERVLFRGGQETPLTPKLLDVLLVLIEERGRTLDKDELVRRVWPDTFIEEGNLARNVSRLRAALGDSPKDERYIRTITRRGYRFVADVKEAVAGDASLPPALSPPAAPPRSASVSSRRRARVALTSAVAALAAVAALGSLWVSRSRRAALSSGGIKAIAVLPFKVVGGDSADEFLGLGLTDALITRLANLRQLTVRPTSTVRPFDKGDTDPLAAGRALAVHAVVEGSVRRVGGRVRVAAQLVSVKDGRHLWAGQFDETATDLLAVEDSIAQRLADTLELRLKADERQRLTARPTRDPAAYEAYLRGRYLAGKLTREGLRQGIEYLDRAIALDPDFALAHDGLAYYHISTADLLTTSREAYPRARAAAERALALDESLAEAHTSLGIVAWQYEWNWPAAERELTRAIALNDNLAMAHANYSFFLAHMGRFDESIAEGRRAQSLDPLTPETSIIAGLSFYYARRFPEAAERLHAIAQLEPSSWLAQATLGRALERQGATAAALAAYERGRRIEPGVSEVLMDLGRAYAALGRHDDARRMLHELESLSRRTYSAPFQSAMIHVGLGDHDRAFALLEKAYEARSWYLTWLKVEPTLDPLRKDPRYADLMRRVGFER
jgi:TolB-like protein/DNA-binding winged helix-turn-helix (wHTH) protein/Tfp pilus assembly protein PilF